MKSVLMIAYFFPPDGSAGSYRPLRFVRHLAKNGWRACVLAGEPQVYERYDPELLRLIPTEVDVLRVRASDPWSAIQSWRGKRIQKKIAGSSQDGVDQIRKRHAGAVRSYLRHVIRVAEACYYHPDVARPWIKSAVNAGLSLCERWRPDVLWASAGPVSAWMVAQRIGEITRTPYVLDLRDPHGLRYYETESLWPQRLQQKMSASMYQLLKGAQSVVFLFESVAESYCRAFPGALDPARIYIIPNGYEGPLQEFNPPHSGKYTVLYTGTITTYRYDTLLDALALLKAQEPEKANQLCFHFIGEGVEKVAADARARGVADIVATTGPLPHAEVARLSREAHALLALGRPSSVNCHELVAGAKIFEYLKARRPILAALPHDETRQVLQRVDVSTIADADSPVEIAAVIRRLMHGWLQGDLSGFLPDPGKCEAYSINRQIHSLVRALEGTPAPELFAPASADFAQRLPTESFA